ncbi:MAG: ATP-dependent RNA helicase HrpA [Granulosicoccus sp.]|nr:ATP-dependent RNA helicase HrpA [Granulosicoccus sp.]
MHRLVDGCLLVDQYKLRRGVRRLASKAGDDADRVRIVQRIEKSRARRAARLANLPTPVYPAELPVVEQREEILAAIRHNQVVILCGETGSGKTTQLPKICLEAGRGVAGLIGHTQPRRIAARSVAARIASELQSSVGEVVGFKIRFTDQVSERTYIKLMTDGILLAEIQNDPWLNQYDTLIIDEAHERSLNIDFLLGYLKRLLRRRPDLKLIITSATIDPQRFAEHFDDAPIITAQGRTYPVELRYEPPEADSDSLDDIDMPTAIVNACETLLRERHHDILVFLSGERDIREMVDLLGKQSSHNRVFRGVDVLPLFSRLSNAEQNRIFQSHSAPRIILATNVAETSLTVPGIRAVVDPGYARLSRYSVRSKVQRLPVEKVSQASANQRSGRCGREAPGVCIRLYSEEDFQMRAEFTEPEILRTNLSSVILQMASMKLGTINDFPFVEAPESKFINDGYRNLQELAALDGDRQLTPLGRRLARLPIDPRLGRMLLASADEGCVREVLTIVSGLSVQDPRERPFDKRQAADELHAEFNSESSDFMAWLNLWNFVMVQKENLSNSQFRKMCRQRFLSPLRIIEWMDVRRQLERLCKELDLKQSSGDAAQDSVHRAVLSGLLANVAIKTDKQGYLGTRNRHLAIFPGSGLFKKNPKWIMAAEVAETSKLYARQVGAIQPEWIEALAKHLLQYSYRDAHWHRKKGTVNAWAQSTLYGLIINPRMGVNYARINPQESRQIFIREALVAGELTTRGEFHRYNQALLDEVTTLEEKSRRRDIVVDPEELVRFYDAIVPEDICTASAFETWRKTFEAEHPRGLYFEREQLLVDESIDVSARDYPDQIEMGGMVLPLRYHFAPGEEDDGVTLICPVEVLNRVSSTACEWLVPGMLEEKITLMIKALPKSLRRNFVPAPDFAAAANAAMTAQEGSLCASLSRQLQRMTGVAISQEDWDCSNLPAHLSMHFEVIGSQGQVLRSGRDLGVLQQAFVDEVEETLLRFSDNSIERDQVSDWNFGDLPESVNIERSGMTLQGYPALLVNRDGVGIKLFATHASAMSAMPAGVRALYRQVLKEEVRYLQRKLPNIDVLSLRFTPFGSKKLLVDDIIDAAIDEAFIDRDNLPRTRDAFTAALESGRPALVGIAGELCDILGRVFEQHRQVAKRLEGSISLSWIEPAVDIRDQIAQLIYAGFVTRTGLSRLARLPVYFQAMNKRLDAIDMAPDKDRRRRAELLPVWESFKALPTERDDDPVYRQAHADLRWAFEELRVSLFAQDLGTREKVSVSRLEKRVSELGRWLPKL